MVLVKRKCSECGKEVEYESDRRNRADLFFCSVECCGRFWKRDAWKRTELGWPPLRDEEGNIAFPLEKSIRLFGIDSEPNVYDCKIEEATEGAFTLKSMKKIGEWKREERK